MGNFRKGSSRNSKRTWMKRNKVYMGGMYSPSQSKRLMKKLKRRPPQVPKKFGMKLYRSPSPPKGTWADSGESHDVERMQ